MLQLNSKNDKIKKYIFNELKLAPTTMSMPLFTGKDGTKMIAQDSVVQLI